MSYIYHGDKKEFTLFDNKGHFIGKVWVMFSNTNPVVKRKFYFKPSDEARERGRLKECVLAEIRLYNDGYVLYLPFSKVWRARNTVTINEVVWDTIVANGLDKIPHVIINETSTKPAREFYIKSTDFFDGAAQKSKVGWSPVRPCNDEMYQCDFSLFSKVQDINQMYKV